MKKKINVVILMAGSGARCNLYYNKAFYSINNIPLFMYSLYKFINQDFVNKIYIVTSQNDFENVCEIISSNNIKCEIILGGSSRFLSVQNAIKAVDKNYDTIIHDAARPLTNIQDIIKLIETTTNVGTLYHEVSDTIKDVSNNTKTVNRNNLYAVSTPQYFNKSLYNEILNNEIEYTDELQIFENKLKINFVKETSSNLKVTYESDFEYISYMLNPKHQLVGHSYDFHKFSKDRLLILGGINIPHDQGLLGHSDADALYHAVTEAIIGALNLGDIGTLFPDNNKLYKDMDSSYFLKEIMDIVNKQNKIIYTIDAIIYAEKPNLKDYKILMANNIKKLTNCKYVNVKATTMEKTGLVGNGFGIGCEAICTLVDKF